ncbi:metallophosphoesterase [Clostridium sp. UBA7503]|uniref:metallophosphoesterase n=1 Tax=Clostridium sp. UBA7503 TaxID=1946377 RepID=UPI00321763ED
MKSKLKRKSIVCATAVVITVLLYCFFYWQNNGLMITEYDYINEKVTADTDGYTIIQISDLHNKKFGTDNKKLIDKIAEENPDMIVITGDIVDSKHTDINVAISFVENIVDIAPVYYVTGNHECYLSKDDFKKLEENMKNKGVHLLDNDYVSVNDNFYLMGIEDQNFSIYDNANILDNTLNDMMKNVQSDALCILLAHEPQQLDNYAKSNMDLVLSGHAHGGQFRIPFTDIGIVAPDQGFFPKYTAGEYEKDNTYMYVSRGLGNSIIPIRLFNRPEIVKVILKNKE